MLKKIVSASNAIIEQNTAQIINKLTQSQKGTLLGPRKITVLMKVSTLEASLGLITGFNEGLSKPNETTYYFKATLTKNGMATYLGTNGPRAIPSRADIEGYDIGTRSETPNPQIIKILEESLKNVIPA